MHFATSAPERRLSGAIAAMMASTRRPPGPLPSMWRSAARTASRPSQKPEPASPKSQP
jgi:hypothetical protein